MVPISGPLFGTMGAKQCYVQCLELLGSKSDPEMGTIFWLKIWDTFFGEIEFTVHQNDFPESALGPKMEPGNEAKLGRENEPQIGTQNQRQAFSKPTPRNASKPASKPISEYDKPDPKTMPASAPNFVRGRRGAR